MGQHRARVQALQRHQGRQQLAPTPLRLSSDRRQAIEAYIAEYAYDPDVTELKVVLGKLYELADRQTRALVDFGLVASRPYIAGLHTPRPERSLP